jgi:hypothetical protein
MIHQIGLQALQSAVDEVNTAIVLVLQLFQDLRVEDEERQHVSMLAQRTEETVVIRQPQVASEPMDADAWFHHLDLDHRANVQQVDRAGRPACGQRFK